MKYLFVFLMVFVFQAEAAVPAPSSFNKFSDVVISNQICPPDGVITAERLSVVDGKFVYCAKKQERTFLDGAKCLKTGDAQTVITESVGALAALAFVLALSYIHRKAISHVNEVLQKHYDVLQKHYGGVYKRIDENRELLELLEEKAPDFLREHFWVEGWLQSQDLFLNNLAESIPADSKLPRFNVVEGKFPRPWPASTNRKKAPTQ